MFLKKTKSLFSSFTLNAQFPCIRFWHDRSQVPRIVDDRRKRMTKFNDTGYFYRYHRPEVDPLPRIPDNQQPVFKPKYKVSKNENKLIKKSKKVKTPWRPSHARFGEFDYIDILGNGGLHPAQLLYHVPRWLRGFPGQHKANELIKLVHYRF